MDEVWDLIDAIEDRMDEVSDLNSKIYVALEDLSTVLGDMQKGVS